jgi:hypothetical protein
MAAHAESVSGMRGKRPTRIAADLAAPSPGDLAMANEQPPPIHGQVEKGGADHTRHRAQKGADATADRCRRRAEDARKTSQAVRRAAQEAQQAAREQVQIGEELHRTIKESIDQRRRSDRSGYQ